MVIGQLLVSIVGFGRLFEIYSSRFLMEHFWALLFVLFAFAFAINDMLVWLERLSNISPPPATDPTSYQGELRKWIS